MGKAALGVLAALAAVHLSTLTVSGGGDRGGHRQWSGLAVDRAGNIFILENGNIFDLLIVDAVNSTVRRIEVDTTLTPQAGGATPSEPGA